MNKMAVVAATLLGIGYVPVAPGTVASAVICLGYLLLWPVDASLLIHAVFFLIMAAVFFVGLWASGRAEKILGPDPASVVIDEAAGMMTALVAVPVSWPWVFASFLFFRLFDITKWLGVRRAEALPGGLGIMMDDIAAGLWALIAVHTMLLIVSIL